MLSIRTAEKNEIEWINQRYDEVEFVHSHFEKEIIAIAEYANEKAGLGRLVSVDDRTLELGGIYVFDQFRGKGIAREIVNFLLQKDDRSKSIYCIPFGHLLPFYQQCGFTLCSNLEQVPQELLRKYHWCNEKYSHPTELLILTS